MSQKNYQAPENTITYDRRKIEEPTGNIYEAISIISKRSEQIAQEMKIELNQKLEEFATHTDTLEEFFENREQIEVSKYYEKLPKPTAIALREWLDGEVYFRKPQED